MTFSPMPELRKFVAPEFIFGRGARTMAATYARNLGARKVLVVSDPGVIEAGWTAQVTATLDEAGLPYVVYSGVTPNPRSEEVMEGTRVFREEGCNLIMAIGGGSPIDCAKGIGIVSSNDRHILEFEGVDMVSKPMPPLICIPTTSGTSADVSQFAIISDLANRIKIAVISKAVVPDVALIDPETLTTMSPYLTACTGIDALVHGIEAYVSVASSPITDTHAIKGIELISTYLIDLMHDQNNIELRSKIMLGSLEAGLAFSNASLGAAHAMSHSLGGLLDLPHGECNAILLEHVMAFNHECAPERFSDIGRAMGLSLEGMTTSEQKMTILKRINQIRRDVSVDRTLGTAGVHRTDVPELAANALKDPCMITNPRRPVQRDIEVVYEEAL